MKQIKTIYEKGANTFDTIVNEALEAGWVLTHRTFDAFGFLAELEIEIEDPKAETNTVAPTEKRPDPDTIQKMIGYVDEALDPAKLCHWIGETFTRSNNAPEMVYVRDWWIRCMKPDLLAVRDRLRAFFAEEEPKE